MAHQAQKSFSLVMRQGPLAHSTFVLDKDVVTLGRATDNDIVILESEVSRHHARLIRQGESWVLHDLGSRNGTFVNGQRITGPLRLTEGNQVALGPNVVFAVNETTPASSETLSSKRPAPHGGVAPLPNSGSRTESVAPVQAAPQVRKSSTKWYVLLGSALVILFLLTCAAVLAYLYLNASQPVAAEVSASVGPDIALQDPAPGSQVNIGDSVLVFATARDQHRVTRMELWVDEQLIVQQDSPDPAGVTPLSLIHSLIATREGNHAVRVRAYNSLGGTSESATLYIGVSGGQAPSLAQYVIQAGDTQETITQMMSTTVRAIMKENPGLGKVTAPGQVIIVPVVAGSYVRPQGGAQPSSAGWSGGTQGTPQPKPPDKRDAQQPPSADGPGLQSKGGRPSDKRDAQNPPQGSAGAPLLNAQPGDCTVTLTWSAVPIAAKYIIYAQISPSSNWQTVADLKADQRTYEAKDLKPGTYFYKVKVQTVAGKWAESAPQKVIVAPSAKCIPRGDYKLVHFQPLKFEPVDPKYKQGALFVTLGGVTGRKIPSSQGEPYPLPDWSAKKIEEVWPAPMSLYLNPDEPLRLEVTGEGWEAAGKKPQTLKSFERTHTASEVGPRTELTGGNGQFKLTYRLWLEDTKWTGKGTAASIKPPPELRLAKDVQDVHSKLQGKEIYACHQGCDPHTNHVLLWDFAGDEKAIEGYIVYRGYSCPGQDGQIRAPQVLGKQYQGLNIPARSEPVGCAARYQVSAFGPAGESAPSNEVTVNTASAVSRVKVTFKNLTLSRLTTTEVYLQANEYKRWSKTMVIPSGTSDLSALYFDDRKGNNTLTVNLGPGETLQVSVQAGACQIGLRSVDTTKSATYTLEQGGADKCSATVEVDTLGPLPAGQVARPQADVGIMHPYLIGKDVYIRLDSLGPDVLASNRVELTSYWLTPGVADKPLTSKQTLTRWWSPAAATTMEVRVGSTDDVGQLDPKTVPLYIEVKPLDFDDPYQANNVWREEIPELLPLAGGIPQMPERNRPDGELCSQDDECKEDSFCLNGRRCASLAANVGNASAGEYCHSDDQCASSVCLCKYGSDGKYCNKWNDDSAGLKEYGLIGTCIAAGQNGAPCLGNGDCASGSCADVGTEKRCAPPERSGQAGDSCYHRTQCKSGMCKCPEGVGFTGHCLLSPGVCAAQLENGADCNKAEECRSGYCADISAQYPGKCAPKNGTGQPGDYCHHDDHCGIGYCECAGFGPSDGKFCKNWLNFNPTWHPRCDALETGQTCTIDKDCETGHCAGVTPSQPGKCAPKSGTGEEGDYCISDGQCTSNMCDCPKGSTGDPCSGWEKFTSSNHGVCRALQPIGGSCWEDAACESGKCDGWFEAHAITAFGAASDAWGKCVSKERHTAKAGEYCHNHEQCASGYCLCPDNAYDGNSCKDWLKRNFPSEQGRCALEPVKKSDGDSCSANEECESWYCADAWPWQKGKCAPKDGTGQVGDYCHHDNHCASGACVCPDYKYDGAFCKDWAKFSPLTHGTCSLPAVKKRNGDYCAKGEECISGYCADGKRCAPKDGTGQSGDYCHHNNHCRSKTCDCPKGTDWLGFCQGWETLNWQKGQSGTCY